MDNRTIDVIIPTYRPGKEFRLLLERLKQQSVPVRRVVIINTEKNSGIPAGNRNSPLQKSII